MILKHNNKATHKISNVKETIAVFMLNLTECSGGDIPMQSKSF